MSETESSSCLEILSQMDDTLLQSNQLLNEAKLLSISIEKEVVKDEQESTQISQDTDQSNEISKLQKEIKRLKLENKEQEEYIDSLRERHTKEQKILQTQIDLSEKHIETLQQNLNSHKKLHRSHLQQSTPELTKRASLPVDLEGEQTNGSVSSPSTVHAITKSQQLLVAKKNKEIAYLQREVEQLKSQLSGNIKEKAKDTSIEKLIELETTIQKNEDTISNLKNRFVLLKAFFCGVF